MEVEINEVLFVELSLLMRFRIAVSAGVGIFLIGIFAWPIAAPAEPFAAVLADSIGFSETVTLGALAFLSGLIAYFLCWPYGQQIGVLAVPFGLGTWAVRSGDISGLIRSNPGLLEQQELFAMLRWGPIYWLLIVAIGYAGVLAGQVILRSKKISLEKSGKSVLKLNIYIRAAISIVVTVLISQFFIRILAQDVSIADKKLGAVAGQPSTGQIVFAVLVSFGLAGFIVKKFFDVSYIWPTIAGAFVTTFVGITYAKADILAYLVGRWPAVFFSNSVLAILPIQMISFGAIGAIAGYWIAIRFDYWRQHEMQG